MAVKIFLDTDIGTDIDDAICLTYLLANPECDLLGITTVTGEPEKRAMLASSLCVEAGKDIPIYPGNAEPLVIEQQQKIAQQARSLSKWEHKKNFPRGQAIEFMRNTITENPGEVILLTIGPLTNVAALFKKYKEVPSLLKGLVMMCGHFKPRKDHPYRLEWNARGDYHATDIVYRENVRMHRSIGIDVTSKVTMDSIEFRERFSADIFRPLHDYANHWYDYSHTITFHDPLAAAIIFNSNICSYEKGTVTVTLDDSNNAGFTYWNKDEKGRHEIASTVNKEEFLKEYFKVFSK
jgi:inosine-uridine nucleoside N-ribohydrolase